MVTYYNRKDFVSFGRYLLSEKRKALFQASYDEAIENGFTPVPVEDSLREVHHSDIENWIHDEPRSDKSIVDQVYDRIINTPVKINEKQL